MKLTFITIFSIFYACLVSCNAQKVITSSGTCIRDGDCKEDSEFCDNTSHCRNLLSKGEQCLDSANCKEGLFCYDEGYSSLIDRPLCIQQRKPSERCNPFDPFDQQSCATDGNFSYKCSIESDTCGVFGVEGDRCRSQYDCQPGNYCMNANTPNERRCAMKKPKGDPCYVLSKDGLGTYSSVYECEGQCAVGSSDFEEGICTGLSSIGQACRSDDQCAGYETSRFHANTRGTPNVICNIPKGDSGLCMNERDLIKKEGMNCNPDKDACDFHRGLSCRHTSTGPKCMFNAFDEDGATFRFCDINGNFSKCNLSNGRPTECRREYNTEPGVGQYFECRTKTEMLPQGSICGNVEYSVCELGTSCQTIPGVSSERYGVETKFCVAIKGEGESCGSKFETACAKGLDCEDNVCVKGVPQNIITHAGLSLDCKSLPCVPGTECVSEFGFSTCELKTVFKSKGTCYPTATTKIVSLPFLFGLSIFRNHICTQSVVAPSDSN